MINPLEMLLAIHSLWKPSQNMELIIKKNLCLDKMNAHFPSGSKISTSYVKKGKKKIKISEEDL